MCKNKVTSLIKMFAYTLVVLLFTWVATELSQAAKPERCGQCGMELSKYLRTRYEIKWVDGTVTRTCGVQCGLTQQLKHGDRFSSAVAKDYLSGNLFDAKRGSYVFSSKVLADMAPGFIAFETRKKAEDFAKEHGGQVLSFDEALSTWRERKTKR